MSLAPYSAARLIKNFLAHESAGGFLLMAAAALALLLANSPWATSYVDFQHLNLHGISLTHAVNDGLMVLFFLLIGLEIKRELLGRSDALKTLALPAAAAAGGMAVPALLFMLVIGGNAALTPGWAVSSATDIAFALAVISLLGNRVPLSLKLFLTAVAILDDLGAILIIALFYTPQLSLPALTCAAGLFMLLLGLNRAGIKSLWPYLGLGLLLWAAVLASGVHATIAGVLLALTIPLHAKTEDETSPLHKLEHALQPWVAYVIVPLFGFLNAGLALSGLGVQSLLHPLTAGIALGLFAGKQLGIFGSVWLLVRSNLAPLPAGSTWSQLHGVAVLCGIGFTMSLFIGTLAFPGSSLLQNEIKLGVLAGSLASALAGLLILHLAAKKAP